MLTPDGHCDEDLSAKLTQPVGSGFRCLCGHVAPSDAAFFLHARACRGQQLRKSLIPSPFASPFLVSAAQLASSMLTGGLESSAQQLQFIEWQRRDYRRRCFLHGSATASSSVTVVNHDALASTAAATSSAGETVASGTSPSPKALFLLDAPRPPAFPLFAPASLVLLDERLSRGGSPRGRGAAASAVTWTPSALMPCGPAVMSSELRRPQLPGAVTVELNLRSGTSNQSPVQLQRKRSREEDSGAIDETKRHFLEDTVGRPTAGGDGGAVLSVTETNNSGEENGVPLRPDRSTSTLTVGAGSVKSTVSIFGPVPILHVPRPGFQSFSN